MAEPFNNVAFVESLDQTRRMRGLSWRAVALEAGLVPSTVYRISRGGIPDLSNFAALVDWLGVSADEFLFARVRPRVEVSLSSDQRIRLDFPGDGTYLTTRELEFVQATFAAMAEQIAKAKAAGESAA